MTHHLHDRSLSDSTAQHVPASRSAQVMAEHLGTPGLMAGLRPPLAKRPDALANVPASQVRKESRHDSTRPPLQVLHSC